MIAVDVRQASFMIGGLPLLTKNQATDQHIY
jgi:hypothetical protein